MPDNVENHLMENFRHKFFLPAPPPTHPPMERKHHRSRIERPFYSYRYATQHIYKLRTFISHFSMSIFRRQHSYPKILAFLWSPQCQMVFTSICIIFCCCRFVHTNQSGAQGTNNGIYIIYSLDGGHVKPANFFSFARSFVFVFVFFFHKTEKYANTDQAIISIYPSS